MAASPPFETWLRPDDTGLYCVPGDFHIDPRAGAERAIVTHGHSDHARSGHAAVLATPETLAIMRLRLGAGAGGTQQALAYGEPLRLGDVTVRLVPAGHILGAAQVVIEYRGQRAVVSGDYKRRADPTCAPFEPVICDLFVTEATFGLPVFRHPPDAQEIGKLLHSLRLFPERCHAIGVYALGKCQRVLSLLRQAGYAEPIYIHGALQSMCALYERFGIRLGPLLPATSAARGELAGRIILAPPSALSDLWARRMPDPVVAMASGWMRIKQRAKARGVELPLVISDHADWDELTATMAELGAGEIWVTHGAEEALIRQAMLMGLKARALSLVGFEDEAE